MYCGTGIYYGSKIQDERGLLIVIMPVQFGAEGILPSYHLSHFVIHKVQAGQVVYVYKYSDVKHEHTSKNLQIT